MRLPMTLDIDFAADIAMRSKPGPLPAVAEPGCGLMEAAMKSEVIDQPNNPGAPGPDPVHSELRTALIPPPASPTRYFCKCLASTAAWGLPILPRRFDGWKTHQDAF